MCFSFLKYPSFLFIIYFFALEPFFLKQSTMNYYDLGVEELKPGLAKSIPKSSWTLVNQQLMGDGSLELAA